MIQITREAAQQVLDALMRGEEMLRKLEFFGAQMGASSKDLQLDIDSKFKKAMVPMLAALTAPPAPQAQAPLIGCVQHDCAECRAKLAAPQAPPAVTVEVDRGRVWIVKGVQRFMLAYDADEPEEDEWYAEQLRGALSIITPDVKTAQPAQPNPLPTLSPDAWGVGP